MGASKEPKLRWRTKLRTPAPTDVDGAFSAVEGYFIWVDGDDHAARSWDPVYAQRLDLLDHHPGFAAELAHLRVTAPSPDATAAAAAKWQVTEADLAAILAGRPLTDTGDKIFVELGPTEFVLHVPRPLTAARRKAIERWAIETRRWPQLHESADGAAWQGQRDAHQARNLMARLDWYDRWMAGERPRDIAESLSPAEAALLPEENIRTTLQRIHEQLKRISPEGLRSPAP